MLKKISLTRLENEIKNRFRIFYICSRKKTPLDRRDLELWYIKNKIKKKYKKAKMLGSLFATVGEKWMPFSDRWDAVGVCEKKLTSSIFSLFLSTFFRVIESSIINNSLVKNCSKIISKIDPKKNIFSVPSESDIRWCLSSDWSRRVKIFSEKLRRKCFLNRAFYWKIYSKVTL